MRRQLHMDSLKNCLTDMERGRVIQLYDFTKFPVNNKGYGGNSGLKLGVNIDGKPWMIKFPKSTAGFRSMEISYTTSPLSEYIGSKIYEAIGIPVHETCLGIYNNKVVVACKDFLSQTARMREFAELKNRYTPELEEYLASSKDSGLHGIVLEVVEKMFQLNPALQVEGLEEHFWDMFVVDALIGNGDRNNGNWGVLEDTGKISIAPVYDNGNAFRNKASDRQLQKTLLNPEAMRDSAYRIQGCYFEDEDGNKINPHKYIVEMKNAKCNEAILRTVPRMELSVWKDIIYEIPNEWEGWKIISDIQKEYYFKVMEMRYQEILLPVWKKMKQQDHEHDDMYHEQQMDISKRGISR